MFEQNKKVLVVAPHPDDEVLGVGGTIARFSSIGAKICVLIITRGSDEELTKRNRSDALEAHRILGVSETRFLDFPAAGLDQTPHAKLNQALSDAFSAWRPDVLFLPFQGDIHRDHKEVFESALVAVRPNNKAFPRTVACYETLSETNWNAPFSEPYFRPSMYLSIEGFLREKIEAFRKFSLQVQKWPHERSVEGIEALAMHRGATVRLQAAEAFMLVRHVI